MIKKFKTTEKSVRLIESENTIVMEVENSATKTTLKKEVEEKLKVKVKSVNIINHQNKKFAYVKLDAKNPAIDLATKFGVI
jgi:large subunit ribosomal protein L23